MGLFSKKMLFTLRRKNWGDLRRMTMFKIDANNAVEIEKKAGAETDYAENPAYSNCKNCAAPLRTSKCEYCGTEYGTVTINGETIKV